MSNQPEPHPDNVITIRDDDEFEQAVKSQKKTAAQKPRNLTLITGSCILKHVEIRFLADNVRVKSYPQAKIETLEENITNMDLSRYEKLYFTLVGMIWMLK